MVVWFPFTWGEKNRSIAFNLYLLCPAVACQRIGQSLPFKYVWKDGTPHPPQHGRKTTDDQLQQVQMTISSSTNCNCVTLYKILILKKNQICELVSSTFLVYMTLRHRALLGLYDAATENWPGPWQLSTHRWMCATCRLGAKHFSCIFLPCRCP